MSRKNLFTTAPRIKIRSGGSVIGYAIGLDVNVSVSVQPVYVIGEYKPVALETLMYEIVSGTFQIMRTKSNIIASSNQQTGTITYKYLITDAQGNQVEATGPTVPPGATQVSFTGTSASNTVEGLNQGKLFRQIDPRTILFSETFDLDLYLKVPVAIDGTNSNTITKEALWFTITNCRITSRNTNISMGQLLNTPLNFQGLLAGPATTSSTPTFGPDNNFTQT